MHVPFDPDIPLGPWIYYIVFACSSHVVIEAVLAILSLIFGRIQRTLLTLGTCIAIASGAGFLICLAFGNDMEPDEAMQIAQRVIVAAPIVGTALFLWCLSSWRTMYQELDRPLWYGLTAIGGCGTAAIVLLIYVVGPIPGFEPIFALFLLGFLLLYWSPT